MFKVLSILADIELPVYQNAHVNSVWEKLYSSRCLFYFQRSTVNIYKYKGKYLLRRIAHGPHGNFNPFVISNKQAHIINQLRYIALRFLSHKWVSKDKQYFCLCASVLLSQKRASNYIIDNKLFSLLMF